MTIIVNVPLSEVCDIVGGSQPPKTDFIYQEKPGYIRLIQIQDYKSDKRKTYIPKSKTKRFCSKKDIMIGRYGPPIFQILRGLDGAYNVALMKASPKDDKVLDREYLYYFLQNKSLLNYIISNSERTAGQDGVRKELLDEYPIPLPPLAEQKRIAAIALKNLEAVDFIGEVPSITLSYGFKRLARSLLLASALQILSQSHIHQFLLLPRFTIRFNQPLCQFLEFCIRSAIARLKAGFSSILPFHCANKIHFAVPCHLSALQTPVQSNLNLVDELIQNRLDPLVLW